jgi:hypothetical protein
MEQEVLVENTIGKIKRLPATRIQEVDDFIEFIIGKNKVFSYNLTEMLTEITDNNLHDCIETGMPTGNEIW